MIWTLLTLINLCNYPFKLFRNGLTYIKTQRSFPLFLTAHDVLNN